MREKRFVSSAEAQSQPNDPMPIILALAVEVANPYGSAVDPRPRMDRCPALAPDLPSYPSTDSRSSASANPVGSEVLRQPGARILAISVRMVAVYDNIAP